jgi:glucosamine--fructose-6-phosphate aminotransferase (isomerizing)
MSVNDAQVLLREAMQLGADLRAHRAGVADSVRAVVAAARLTRSDSFYFVGNGDSGYVASAAEWAFDSLGLHAEALAPRRFLDRNLPRLVASATARHVVFVLSASGRTPAALELAARARAHDLTTIGITTTPDSPLTQSTDFSVVVELTGKEASPGVRTYQASMFVALLFAVAVADDAAAHALELELDLLPARIDETVALSQPICEQAAAMLVDAPAVLCVGSGSQAGTARFAAAKLVEGAGIPAFAQDLDEWCHVERLIDPRNPVIVIAPPGQSEQLATKVSQLADRSGRAVVLVAPASSENATALRMPIAGECSEALSPFLYSVWVPLLAASTASLLGRTPFHFRVSGG